MDARLFILTQINEAFRQMALNDFGSPTWSAGQLVRACALRLERGDVSAWSEFQQRVDSDSDLTNAILSILIDQAVVIEALTMGDVTLNLPKDVKPFSIQNEKHFLRSLNVWKRRPVAVFAHPHAQIAPEAPYSYKRESPDKFLAPSKKSCGEIMYIEMKPGLSGPARIARVTFSKTRKTIYFEDKILQSLKGTGYKANYYNVESGLWYWISKCRQDGKDALYPNIVEIDEDVREEYWEKIRNQPKSKHLTNFRSPGKHTKRSPR